MSILRVSREYYSFFRIFSQKNERKKYLLIFFHIVSRLSWEKMREKWIKPLLHNEIENTKEFEQTRALNTIIMIDKTILDKNSIDIWLNMKRAVGWRDSVFINTCFDRFLLDKKIFEILELRARSRQQ